MRLYYTNISDNNGSQTRSDLSLGGYKSSTLIPNNSVGNLFNDISCYTVRENREEFIAIVLVNETGSDAGDVTIHIDYPTNPYQKFEMAFVAFNDNDEIEIVPTIYSQPYNADFNDIDGVSNAVNIGNIAAGDKIGVWVKRIINKEVINDIYSTANLEENGNPEEEDQIFDLVVNWNTL